MQPNFLAKVGWIFSDTGVPTTHVAKTIIKLIRQPMQGATDCLHWSNHNVDTIQIYSICILSWMKRFWLVWEHFLFIIHYHTIKLLVLFCFVCTSVFHQINAYFAAVHMLSVTNHSVKILLTEEETDWNNRPFYKILMESKWK